MIAHIFTNVDMRLSHRGLRELCSENDINLDLLNKGQYVIFVNGKKNLLKMMSTAQVFAYLRMEKGRTIDMSVIKSLPSYFRDGAVNYNKALESKIKKEFEIRAFN